MPQILDLEVQAMLAADAKLISRWRYSGQYALYDRPISRESESEECMLDPRNGFHAVRGLPGLVGFWASRLSQILAFVALAGCCQTAKPPSQSESVQHAPQKLAAPSSPAVSSISSPRSMNEAEPPARALEQCPRGGDQQAWRPLQTASVTNTTMSCERTDCVEVTPVERSAAGCAEFGSRCGATVLQPRLGGTSTEIRTAVQSLLDAQVVQLAPVNDPCWLSSLDYTIHHNGHGILDVTFRARGAGAYPSTQTLHLAVDLRTGRQLSARTVFEASRLDELRALVHSNVRREWKRALGKHRDTLEGWSEPTVRAEDLENFVVLADRLVFLFDFGLPHAIESASPSSEFPIAKAELRRFIQADGPLAWLL